MKVVGVDGCRGGWFAVSGCLPDIVGNVEDDIEGKIFQDIRALWDEHDDARLILIDMPIGLPETCARSVERLARRLLSKQASSIFPVPCRRAVYADTYKQACAENISQIGSSISKQSWNICDKIRMLDEFLRETADARPVFQEAHPELSFRLMAARPLPSKKTPDGVDKRLRILHDIHPACAALYQQISASFRRKVLSLDDILDALILFCVAAGEHKSLPAEPDLDTFGLPMKMVIPSEIP